MNALTLPDEATREHLRRWLDAQYGDRPLADETAAVSSIAACLHEYGDALERFGGWSEIRDRGASLLASC